MKKLFTIILTIYYIADCKATKVNLNCNLNAATCTFQNVVIKNEETTVNLIVPTDKSKIKQVIIKNSQLLGIPQEIFDEFPNMNLLGLHGSSLQSVNILKNCSSLTNFRLTNVESFKIVDSAFKECKSLSVLSLISNSISSLKSKSLEGLENLKDLTILTIAEVSQNLLDSLINLKHLKLGYKITEIPEFLFKNLWSLEIIELSYNELEKITDNWFHNLTNLRSINIERNQISQIPIKTFESQLKMSLLDLSSNQIENINFVKNLNFVDKLQLSKNNITNIETLGNCTFSILQLSSNPIEIIDLRAFENCTSLKKLDLQDTKILNLNSQSFIHLKNLEQLFLSGHQQLKKIPDGLFEQNQKLEILFLDKFSDQLELPEEIFQNNLQLTKLRISESNLIKISDNLVKNNVNLTWIDLSDNKISRIGTRFIHNCPKLEDLNLKKNLCVDEAIYVFNLDFLRERLKPCNWAEGGCSFEEVESRYTCLVENFELKSFEASGDHLPGKSDSDVEAVKFENSNLDSIPEKIFSKFLNLKYLDMHATGVQNLDSLKNCGNLEKLILSANQLKILQPAVFQSCSKLKFIDLSQNELQGIQSDLFIQNSNLEFIDLSHNRINAVQPCKFLRNLSSIKEINLFNNDCVSRSFLFEDRYYDTANIKKQLRVCFKNW